MGDKIVNPINSNYNSILVESIPSSAIIDKYKKEFDLDVSIYFIGFKHISIYECAVSKYRFYYPFTTIGDGKFYEQLSANKKKYYHKRWEHEEAVKYFRKSAIWLEVGSGNSFFLNKLNEKEVHAIGLELNQDTVEDGLQKKLKVLNQDFFSYQNRDDKFDVIALFQVLEHMYRISDFFKKAHELLKPDGKIVFSVPNSNPYLFIFDKYHTLNLPPHHMGLWDVHSVKLAGREFGFRVVECQTEMLSNSEFEYMINLKTLSELIVLDLKLAFIKLVFKFIPRILKGYWSKLCRKLFLQGRNIFVVLEKI